MRSVAQAIGAAPLETAPFPHFVARDVLPPATVAAILKYWPPESQMLPEPGGLGRFWLHLIPNRSTDTRVWRPSLRGAFWRPSPVWFWQTFARGIGLDVVRAALARFHQFNAARFPGASYRADLTLFESGPQFEQHHAHTHAHSNPGWAMTFLLFLDDGGRHDRGEVFSAPLRGTSWFDVVAQGPNLPLQPMKQIPFTPNTLLAWMDGPQSFHGTEKLALDPVNRRRMLRCHVAIPEEDVIRLLGVNSAGFSAACERHRAGDSVELAAILKRPGNPIEALPRFTFA